MHEKRETDGEESVEERRKSVVVGVDRDGSVNCFVGMVLACCCSCCWSELKEKSSRSEVEVEQGGEAGSGRSKKELRVVKS